MHSLVAAVRNFTGDEEGITAIEYGLIAALIVVAISTALTTLGTTLSGKFDTIRTTLTGS
ncbi:Flp family type IVb pilin [Duganella sp. FT92W]|uniref:Flp family type IVb pilin n=1 Tax=Pseudoduganella rivuli TaxID=2666085 RepID=A0A7X2IK73_9BURK|nr:Flp family type IVb pilin [Pseudoduganella rivuli]MRV71062.1 Flp family type IVb pilin [Pseudoduganella rivuli]